MADRGQSPMALALEIARNALGTTAPNPMVGCVCVDNRSREIVATGWHQRAGMPHAERNALAILRERGIDPAGVTMYVTLEPCSTHGHTGACTDAIVAAGISKVVIGALDPNPLHRGRAIEILRSRGIAVEQGELAQECAALNPIFNHTIVHKTPLFAARCAITRQGAMFFEAGKTAKITGTATAAQVARERQYFPAIATSTQTVLVDNPRLTIRRQGHPVSCHTRLVFDRSGRTLERLEDLEIYNDRFARERTVFVTVTGTAARAEALLRSRGIALWALPEEPDAYWRELRERCWEAHLDGVYFECGPSFLKTLFEAGQADYLYAYCAGGPPERSPVRYFSDSARATPVLERRLGEDVEQQFLIG
ncbi:MAG: bifunctional diaminohydroxyphosphoribosylaminopyrimidine deaminase/5-amino-6-(5-phosphoribosylamino)uracil reductase RibD [Opitutales bacterium]|nr:bifunctional diaminohydroxyphosphoribosylaminopyrimidine deaminase/5-amino-6-(5-phosphoribosylamino)uracil reductase RibD [Opitutales bacterium]